MTPKITLYGIDLSPPVRTVKLTLRALNVAYKYKLINTLAGEHKTAEYLKINPQHTIPTLEDNGKIIVDSHAISAYLVRKYGADDSLYPKDFYQRAIVDHRLHYENGVIFNGCLRPTMLPIRAGTMTKEKFAAAQQQIDDIFSMLEVFLGDNPYMAGKNLTIADFSILSSVSSLVYLYPLDTAKHPKLAAWLERMNELPYCDEVNGRGARQIQTLLEGKLDNLK